jgi:O-antigen/teichoic acid export membrane protein
MEKGKLHGKCPACGVPDKMFEPYTEKIAPNRTFILSLDLHPVLVHFPQAFIVSILAVSLLAMAIQGSIHDRLAATIIILGLALPFVVIASFLAGMLDGMVRFRRFSTPLLVQKLIFGSLFFLVSCALFAVVVMHPAMSKSALLTVSILGLVGSGCASFLGKIGTSLLNSKFPG